MPGKPDHAPPALLAHGLGRSFGGLNVLGHLDLTVGAGERIALWGANGSGKTTVLRLLAGTLAPSAGRAAICGQAAGTIPARNHLGVAFSHERCFYLRLSGRRNLVFFARLRYSRREAERRTDDIVEELGIGEIAAMRADQCSTGMLQQLAFARALVGEPSVLLLDEPTRSLDRNAVGRFWAALDRRPETAAVIATHREDDVERCTRRIDLPR